MNLISINHKQTPNRDFEKYLLLPFFNKLKIKCLN